MVLATSVLVVSAWRPPKIGHGPPNEYFEDNIDVLFHPLKQSTFHSLNHRLGHVRAGLRRLFFQARH